MKLASEKGLPSRGRFFSGAAESRNKIVYRRRILEITGDRKHKVVLAAVMVVSACMAGGITTFAYEPPDTYVGSDYEDGEEIIASSEPLESKRESLSCDYYFIDEYENIYTAGGGNENGRSTCTHQYISGNVVRHKRDGKGGCTVREWEAKGVNGAVI